MCARKREGGSRVGKVCVLLLRHVRNYTYNFFGRCATGERESFTMCFGAFGMLMHFLATASWKSIYRAVEMHRENAGEGEFSSGYGAL